VLELAPENSLTSHKNKYLKRRVLLREHVFRSAFKVYPSRHLQVYESPLLTQICWQSCPWEHASGPVKKHSHASLLWSAAHSQKTKTKLPNTIYILRLSLERVAPRHTQGLVTYRPCTAYLSHFRDFCIIQKFLYLPQE